MSEGIQTVIAAAIVALPAFITSLVGVWALFRKIEEAKGKIEEVHGIVNSQRAAMQAEINGLKDLIASMSKADAVTGAVIQERQDAKNKA